MTAATGFPPELTTFVGRRFDVDELAQLLTVSRMVTLCGIGGIGKTRLALKVAAEIAERFPAGVRSVELAGADQPHEIVTRIATVLGVFPQGPRPLEDAVVQAMGDGHDVLLILDGCDSLAGDCARLCGRLITDCPGVTILATSREPLGLPGETAWRVPPLSLPEGGDRRWTRDLTSCEAMRLFRDRAAEARPGFSFTRGNTAGVASLVRGLDGIPLAVELVAAATRTLAVEEVVEGVSDHFHELDTPIRRGRPALPRRQILAVTIDWVHHQLSEPERVLLRRVTVFRGTWTLRMAEQVCAGGGLWTEDLPAHARSLIAGHLVVLDGKAGDEPRYRLPGPVRAYAAERLIASGEDDRYRRRHRDYVNLLAEEFDAATGPGLGTPWPKTERLLRQLESLGPDLAGAIGWSIETGDPEPAIRLIVNLRWVIIGAGRCHAQVGTWLEHLLAAAPAHMSASLRGRAVALRGALALMQGRRDEAGEHAEAGLALCRAAQGLAGDALALILLALLDPVRGPQEPHDDLLSGAITIVRTVGDRLVEADALRVQGAPAPADRLREARRAYVTYLWSQERRITVDPSVAHALEVIGPPDRDLEAGAAGVSRANGLEPGISGVNGLEPGTSGVNGLESGASDVNGLESGVSGLNGLESGAPEVDGTSRRPSAVPEGRIPPAGTLTAREHEIALLVSQGLSNRAIAGELVISSATVARHVANILAKLGFSSRTQVAAWMVERRAHQAGGQS